MKLRSHKFPILTSLVVALVIAFAASTSNAEAGTIAATSECQFYQSQHTDFWLSINEGGMVFEMPAPAGSGQTTEERPMIGALVGNTVIPSQITYVSGTFQDGVAFGQWFFHPQFCGFGLNIWGISEGHPIFVLMTLTEGVNGLELVSMDGTMKIKLRDI